jgi:hypothetical protein
MGLGSDLGRTWDRTWDWTGATSLYARHAFAQPHGGLEALASPFVLEETQRKRTA